LKEIIVLIDDSFTESNYFKAVILIKVFFANVKRGKFRQKISSIYLLAKFICSSIRKFLIVSMLLLRLLRSRFEGYHEF
jgi:hypothetical protein